MSTQALVPTSTLAATADPSLPTSRAGDLYYNTGSNKLRVYSGASWFDVAVAGSGGTPATTVVASNVFSQGSSVGTATNYAREDHVHGTPAFPTDMATTDTSQSFTATKTLFTGSAVGGGTGAAQFAVNGATSQVRDVVYMTAGTARWILRVNNDAEGGSNTGSTFQIMSRTDAGGAAAVVLNLERATGNATFATSVTCTAGGLAVGVGYYLHLTGSQSDLNNYVGATSTTQVDVSASTTGRLGTTGGTGSFTPQLTWTSTGVTVAGTFSSTGNLSENGNRVYSAGNKVPVSGISATGTASATTYLRGDGSWSTPSTGSTIAAPTAITSTTTAVDGATYLATGTFTVTVPVTNNTRVTIKNAGTGTITVAPASGTIDNAAFFTISALASIDTVSDGTNVWII